MSCDFETNNNKDDCHVWLWAVENIEDFTIKTGCTIDEFFCYLMNLPGKSHQGYFHNIKFDGEFICIWLLNHGYAWTNERSPAKNQFKTLISDMGIWYSIEFRMGNGKLITLYDSSKIYPYSVRELSGAFDMEVTKGEIDYNLNRPIGYKPTEEEIDYVKRDVHIVSVALRHAFEMGDTRMTAGSNALANYRATVSKKLFDYWFPKLDDITDSIIRESYKGGWTYVNPKFKNREIGEGIVLDVNSLYPSRMKFELMPFGEPKYFRGKFKEEEFYPLYVQKLKCSFSVKKNHLPTIQLKKNSRYREAEYIESTHGEIEELTLTSVDLELFFEHYNVKNIEWIGGFKFHAVSGMFDTYIDYWMNQKQEADKNHNKPLRTQSKLKMNSLYGKFAKRPKGRSKKPYLENGVLKLELLEEENQGSLYIPVGTFITAYARAYTIRSAQKNYKRFMYADTDSLHLEGKEIPKEIHVDPYELGAWKHESTFRRAKYLGPKCYVEDIYADEKTIDAYREKWNGRENHISEEFGTLLQITCAGLPDAAKDAVTFKNFEYELEVFGKLRPVHVKGGIVLEETTFKIKRR